MTQPPSASGAFAPLRRPAFAVLWAATILGNTGSFMRDIASAWIVTDLAASPVAVALVQAAGTLPIFLLAIPAGVLSDILDRRKLLIAIQVLLGLVSLTLAVMAASGALTVATLVGLTFIGGVGAALMGPTWQSIVPELVPKTELRDAVALNSLGINVARSIGPAAGGLLLGAVGAAATYGVDVASYLLVIAALVWWNRPASADDALAERFPGAFRAGLRYARASRELHRVLFHALVFFTCCSAIWALLPLVARGLLGGTAGFYGFMLGAVGVGAICGALVMPRLRARLGADGLMLFAAILAALVMAGLVLAPPKPVALVALLALGLAWIVALTTLNGAAQAILPNWVRGRGLAVYLTVFNGAMTGGSLLWGLVAHHIGVAPALLVAAAALLGAGLLLRRRTLPVGEADLAPSNHWPEPLLAAPLENDRGPVTVLIEYRIPAADRPGFLATLHRLAEERRRDGAFEWGVAEDAAEPEIVVEWFRVESWAEHLRQHRRVSKADADVQGAARAFHKGPAEPVVRHLIGGLAGTPR
ncbi:MFS family permease [Methylopila capsulata]|uniref:MFS family permease n=1 Tax=Methylopila capsulata TaxID=61654 RepID=A0A9W6IXD2_9HYPH|nr:MFS transporter [Methylopila capsulata]MBM7852634.1 MFS family permease [Methylopila capsulata]GLK56841.1 MFS transporter [Methylopila capsulata]